MYLACDGDDVLGSAYGLRASESSDMARIGGMWVAPLHRRHGIGRALLESVLSWSHEHGFKRLSLWAPMSNTAALGLYQQAGFKQTGRRRPLPTNAVVEVVELELSDLSSSGRIASSAGRRRST
jgi:ribosomal protein S18 acetylase RimI-like enzyme